MREFISKYKSQYLESQGEYNASDECVVKKHGYRTVPQQIERLVLAGVRLEQFRNLGDYDFPSSEEIGEDFDAPVYSDPDFVASTDAQEAFAQIQKKESNLQEALRVGYERQQQNARARAAEQAANNEPATQAQAKE